MDSDGFSNGEINTETRQNIQNAPKSQKSSNQNSHISKQQSQVSKISKISRVQYTQPKSAASVTKVAFNNQPVNIDPQVRTKTIKRRLKYVYHLEDIDLSKDDGPPRRRKFGNKSIVKRADSENEEKTAAIAPTDPENLETLENPDTLKNEQEEEEEEESWPDNLSPNEIMSLSISQLVREGKSHELDDLLHSQRYGKMFRQQLNKVDGNGFAPIHYAAKYNQVECTKVILEYAASKHHSDMKYLYRIKGRDGMLPIHLAAKWSGGASSEILNYDDDQIVTEQGINEVYRKAITSYSSENNTGEQKFDTVLELLLNYASSQGALSNHNDRHQNSHFNWRFGDDGSEDILEVSDEYGLSALHHAVQRGGIYIVKKILDYVYAHHTEKVKTKGVSSDGPGSGAFQFTDVVSNIVNNPDKSLMTPLHYAALYNKPEITKELILRGKADLMWPDCDGNLPIHLASSEDHIAVVEILIHSNQNTGAIQNSEKDPEILLPVATLVSDQIFAADSDGSYPLHLALENDCEKVVPYLLKTCYDYLNGENLFSLVEQPRKSDNNRPLHIAASQCTLTMVRLLIKYYKAKTNKQNSEQETPLFLACKNGKTEIAKYLINYGGSNKEMRDSDSYTPLLIASSWGYHETVKMLLEEGADLDVSDKEEKTAFFIAAQENVPNVMRVLLNHDSTNRAKLLDLLKASDQNGNTAYHEAAGRGNIKILKMLLNAEKKVDYKNEDDQTPLHLASAAGRVKCIRILLKADHNLMLDDDADANTALHLACTGGHEHAVECLIELGAKVNARNTNNWTALDIAADGGHIECCEVLLENDSPVNPTDMNNQTPLHLAGRNGHEDVIKLLLSKKADIEIKSRDGLNALDMAIDNGHYDAVEVILDSDVWEQSLRSKIRLANGGVMTPMRRLIEKMPDMAKKVFSKCISSYEDLSALDSNDENDDNAYKFNFEFLDDTFFAVDYDDGQVLEETDAISITSDSKTAGSDDSLEMYVNGRLNRQEMSGYSSDLDILKNSHPLMSLVKFHRTELLSHPLALELLNYKWRTFGRPIYFINLAVYLVFLVFFNFFMLATPAPYVFNDYEAIKSDALSSLNLSCSRNLRNDSQTSQEWKDRSFPYWQNNQDAPVVINILGYIALGIAALRMAFEAAQFFIKPWKYIKSLTNWCEIITYVGAALVIIPFNEYTSDCGIRADWQWEVGVIALIMSWIVLLLFIRKFPRFGIYVVMFTNILITMVDFSFVFALFLLGFAFGYHCLFANRVEFSDPSVSIIKTLVMMIGEYEFNGIFYPDDENSFATFQYHEVLSYFIFVIFVIVMSLIIMNLLVGLAVDDISEVRRSAVLKRLSMRTKTSLEVEFSSIMTWLSLREKSSRAWIIVRPDLKPTGFWSGFANLASWFSSADGIITTGSIEEAMNPELTEIQEIQEQVYTMADHVEKIYWKNQEMEERGKKVEKIVEFLAQKEKDYDFDKL